MLWFYLALSSLLLFSISSILQRKLLRDITDLNPVVFGFIFQILVGLFAIPFFLIYKGTISTSYVIWQYIIIAGILYSFSNFFLYHAIKITEISKISVIGSSRSVWVLLGSIFILNETINSHNLMGIFLIISSLALMFWQKQKKSETNKKSYSLWKNILSCENKGVKFALIATIFSGFAVVIDGLILRDFSIGFYLIISSLFTGFGTIAIKPKSIFKINSFLKIKILIPIIFSAGIFTTAVFLMYTSYQVGGKMSSIIPITQTTAILTIFLSALLLKETKDIPKKIIALGLCVLGIYFLK